MKTIALAFTLVLGTLISINATASGGAFEINQACVESGCFPGDEPGLPVTIVNPGVYVLTSDITTEDATNNVIIIQTDNIELNLSGFSVRGPNICTGEGVECQDESLSGSGISGENRNIMVKNGVVRGFGFGGVVLPGEMNSIERIRTEHNYRVGLRVGHAGTIEDSQSNFNGYLGIESHSAKLFRVSATRNGQYGIATHGSSLIYQAVVIDNPGSGIWDNWGSLIRDSIISKNGQGIWIAAGGSKIIDTQITANMGGGIFFQPAIPPDLPSEETLVSTLSGVSLYENNGGNDNPQISGSGGLWISLGENLCGRDKECEE